MPSDANHTTSLTTMIMVIRRGAKWETYRLYREPTYLAFVDSEQPLPQALADARQLARVHGGIVLLEERADGKRLARGRWTGGSGSR